MSKHTPGPWTAHQGWADTGIVPDHPEWCQVLGPLQSDFSRVSITGHFGMANARLIAAAPELLAALQQMRRWMPVYPAAADGIVGGREAHAAAMAAAKAAIAAATGEQA